MQMHKQIPENGDGGVWVALYLRLSEEDRDKLHKDDVSRSIESQRIMLTSYAESNGWNIYKIYSDDDYTGADRNRPAWNALLKDAENKKFSIILCKSQSRFTREMEAVEHYLHYLFPIWGIRFIGLVDNADTDNEGNKKQRQINGLVNQWYLEDLSVNIKKTLTERRGAGYHIGAFAPYGYRKDPDYKGHLIPDPEAAAVVQRIFEMFASGMGKAAIARRLNADGIPNPTEYKRLHGIRWRRNTDTPRSGMWQYYSINEVLQNEVYIGNLVQGKYESESYKTQKCRPVPKEKWIRVEHTHAPIIDTELWNKVQNLIDAKAKPGWDGQIGIFARKAYCMNCGYTMRTHKARNGRRYLRCSTRLINEDLCQAGGFIAVKELEGIVLEELHKMIDLYLDMDRAEEQLQIRDNREKEIGAVESQITQLKSRMSNADHTLKTLYQDRVDGIISPEEYRRLSDSFKKDFKTYVEQEAALQRQLDEVRQREEATASKRDILRQTADITELNHDIVNTLIDYIEVGRREGHYNKQNKVPVVIHWKF